MILYSDPNPKGSTQADLAGFTLGSISGWSVKLPTDSSLPTNMKFLSHRNCGWTANLESRLDPSNYSLIFTGWSGKVFGEAYPLSLLSQPASQTGLEMYIGPPSACILFSPKQPDPYSSIIMQSAHII